MKAFISVDLEGMPYIVSPEHLAPGRKLYTEARRVATRVTKVVAEALTREGFDEVVVADSHGHMVALLAEELPQSVELVRGFPRPLSMVAGIEGAEAAVFLGYHARAGVARSTFDHTYSGVYEKVVVNGVEASEYLLNAYVAGSAGVPVVLVAGEEKLMEDVEKFTPWAERVVLKRSLSRYSSASPSMVAIERKLREAVRKACEKLRRGEAKPLEPPSPIELELWFATTGYADVAELIPGATRLSGRCVAFKVGNIVEAYRILELAALAAAGLAKFLS